jgi:transposase
MKPNGTIVQTLVDEQRHCRRVLIYFLRQRYRCVCGAYPFQPLPGVAEGRCITKRGAEYVARQCLSHSFEFSANEVGISGKTAKNLFADFVVRCEAERTIETPEVLGIDGVCVGHSRNKKTYCLLTDLSNKAALELLPKGTMLELARFLKQLPKPENLKVVAIDMATGFLTVIRKLYPHAIVVIDPYHILRMLNDAVTRVVREKQKDLTTTEHKKLMNGGNRFLLTTRRSKLTKTQKEKLEEWFVRVPEFKLAFELKEEAFDIWRIKDRGEAERHYDEWLAKIPKELRGAFSKFTGAVRRWRTYIFNYFDFKVSNAYTESRNRDVKSLQREGRRTSFPVLRARFLFAGITEKPHRTRNRMNARQIRAVARKAEEIQQAVRARDPKSYVARIEAARKAKNEFSRLLYPGEKWVARFGHFSVNSDRETPVKWDFIW